MIFSDLPSPAEASSETTNRFPGFAQAGNRCPHALVMYFVTALAAPTASATSLAALRRTSVANEVSATVRIASANVQVAIEVGIPVDVEIAVDVLVLVLIAVSVRIRVYVCICIDVRVCVDVRIRVEVRVAL